MAWCDWMYSRTVASQSPDDDYGRYLSRGKNKNVYDEVRYDYTTYINGKEVYFSDLLGYSLVDVVVKDESEILQREDLPNNAVIFRDKVNNALPILFNEKKLSLRRKAMIQTLFN
jgi:hypothetical protein